MDGFFDRISYSRASLTRWLCIVFVLGCADALSNVVSSSEAFSSIAQTSGSLSINRKVLFETGLLLASIALVIFNGFGERCRRGFFAVFGILLFVGCTALFAQTYIEIHAEWFVDFTFVVFGMGFMGVKFCAFFSLYKGKNYTALVVCIALSKVVKTAIGTAVFSVSAYLHPFLMLLVLCACLCAFILDLTAKNQRCSNEGMEFLGEGFSARYVIIQSIFASVALASIQAFTLYGTYTHAGIASSIIVLVFSLAIPLLSWFFFLRDGETRNMQERYSSAFLVIIAGLFIISAQSSGTWMLSEDVSDLLLNDLEMFGHVVYWIATMSACWIMRDKALRIMGIMMAIFAFFSVLWIMVLQTVGAMVSTLTMALCYVSVVFLLKLLPTKNLAQEQNNQKTLIDDEYLNALAIEYDLSPRETEVFLLLIQGRSRSYIQEQLYIADGTAKTHISRIYRKAGVSGKQELLSQVLADVKNKGNSSSQG